MEGRYSSPFHARRGKILRSNVRSSFAISAGPVAMGSVVLQIAVAEGERDGERDGGREKEGGEKEDEERERARARERESDKKERERQRERYAGGCSKGAGG